MMIRVWDYFMRRKKLLLVLIGLFCLSGYGVSILLQKINVQPEVTYIHLEKWGLPEGEEVAIPRTGQEVINIPSPQVIAEMVWPRLNDQKLPTNREDENMNENIQDENLVQSADQETLYVKSEVVSQKYELTPLEICGDITLMVLGFGVVVLLAYLTYRHFRR